MFEYEITSLKLTQNNVIANTIFTNLLFVIKYPNFKSIYAIYSRYTVTTSLFFFLSKFDILNSYIMGNWFLSQRKPECGCKEHINFSAEKEFSLYKRTSRKCSKDIEDELIERVFSSERVTYLCTTKEKRQKHCTHYVDTIIEFIETDAIDDADLVKIVQCIGKQKRVSLLNDSRSQSLQYKDDTFINSYDPCTWLEGQNRVVLEFLKSLCGIEVLTENKRKSLSLVKLFEQLLLCCCENVIFPLSFTTNLISYFSTGSKTVSEFNNAVSPCDSYSTIMNWINERSWTKNVLPPENDVITFFDNNQVLASNFWL